MRYLIIISFIITFTTCEKQSAIKVDNNFIGEWYYRTAESHHDITIDSKGKGYNIGGGEWPLLTGDQRRKWFVKDTILQFGHASPKEEKFHIDSFPKTSLRIDTLGENFLDIGDNYMWLDGRIYISSN